MENEVKRELCDCELGHNGLGMAIRECDCEERKARYKSRFNKDWVISNDPLDNALSQIAY